MSSVATEDLRRLRKEAAQLNATLVKDLLPFWSETGNTFRRLPTSDTDPNPTTTCSCLMALGLTRRLGDMYGQETYRAISRKLVEKVAAWEWKSSGQGSDNRFTRSIVLRGVGLLRQYMRLRAALFPKEAFQDSEARKWQSSVTIMQVEEVAGRERIWTAEVDSRLATPTVSRLR